MDEQFKRTLDQFELGTLRLTTSEETEVLDILA